MTLGARRSRVLGAIWILAGLGLLAGAVLLWVDRQTVSVWELPLAVVALGVGAWLWSQRVTIDRHGITVSSLRGTERTLWASIDAVEVQATWWRPALTIHRMGNGSRTSVRTSSGLTSSQRARLFDVLHELSRDHGFTIRRSGAPDVASAADLPAGGAAAGLSLIETDVPSTGEGAAEDPAEGAPADDGVSPEGVPSDDGRAGGAPVEDVAGEAVVVEDAAVEDTAVADTHGEEAPGEEDDPRADEGAAGEHAHGPVAEVAAGSDDTGDQGSATDAPDADAAAPNADAAAPDADAADVATPDADAADLATPEADSADAPDGIDPDATDVIEVVVEPARQDTPTAPPAN